MNQKARILGLALLVVGIATGLRLVQVTYGIGETCLAVPQEYWLYDTQQVSALYTWDVRPIIDEDKPVFAPVETLVPTSQAWVLLRLSGALLGVLTVTLTLIIGRRLKANWWWLGGALIAVAPPLVTSDRWLMRFDMAALMVAISLGALVAAQRESVLNRRVMVWIQIVSAASLLLIAPPLWWLSIALILLQPYPKWRVVLFVVLGALMAFPALQSPYYWLLAAGLWDESVVAACIVSLVALSLWRWRQISLLAQGILAVAVLGMGGFSLWNDVRLPNPTPAEWEVVNWLQTHVPDEALVRFDALTWPLNPVVACPMQADIHFVPQGTLVDLPFLPGVRLAPPTADYIVTTYEDNVSSAAYKQAFDGGYFVGYNLPVANPVLEDHGEQFFVLGHQLLTPALHPGDLADVRVDYQFTPGVSIDVLNYSIFIHITQPGQPGDKVMEYSVPVIDSPSAYGPRRLLLNQHYRFSVAPNVPPGTYDVIVGFFKPFTGEAAGEASVISQIEITAAP